MPISFNLEQDATPFFVGFDEFVSRFKSITDAIAEVSVNTATFPSYNMFKLDENNVVFEIFIPGFTSTDISIKMEGPVLNVSGKREVAYQSATKVFGNVEVPAEFNQKFIITDNYKLNEIGYEDGVLHVSFLKVLPPQGRDGLYPSVFKDGVTQR